jgi:hypothetical protein
VGCHDHIGLYGYAVAATVEITVERDEFGIHRSDCRLLSTRVPPSDDDILKGSNSCEVCPSDLSSLGEAFELSDDVFTVLEDQDETPDRIGG